MLLFFPPVVDPVVTTELVIDVLFESKLKFINQLKSFGDFPHMITQSVVITDLDITTGKKPSVYTFVPLQNTVLQHG